MRKDKNLRFSNTIPNVENKNPQKNDSYHKKQNAKKTLISKFNLSEEEAEEKLKEIEIILNKKSPQKSENADAKISSPEKSENTNKYFSIDNVIASQYDNAQKNEKIKKDASKISENYQSTNHENNIAPLSEKKLPVSKEDDTIKNKQIQVKDIETQPTPNVYNENIPNNEKEDITKIEKESPVLEEAETSENDIDLNDIYAHPTQNEKDDGHQIEKESPVSKEDDSSENNQIPVKDIETQPTPNVQNEKDDDPQIEKQQSKETYEEKDVDSILGELVPNFSQDVSIELDHVNLTFDIQEDKIDNLKEQVIRTLKRNKSKTTKFHVLRDISFKIYQGEKVGIIGYNGAGKSTLLKVISGIYSPDSGSVRTNGHISPLLGLGAGFDHNFSGAKNIYLNAAILGYDKEFIEEKYDEIVEFADLGKFINLPIRNYSSGMLAKLGFSIATIVNPDILIIDEILGVGDVNFRRKSTDKMKSLMGGKTTVILVSHSIGQIRELCDKAIWIDKGEVREIGEVNEVCDHYLKDSEKATRDQLKDIQFS